MAANTLKQLTLDKLATLPLSTTPTRLVVDGGDARLNCHLTAHESLACAFDSLKVQIDALKTADLAALANFSKKVADRLTYLLEAIATVETDSQSCTVLLRSTKPAQGAGGVAYYELLVRRGGELEMCRYSKPKGDSNRQRVPCEVTREVFGRLVEDLSTV